MKKIVSFVMVIFMLCLSVMGCSKDTGSNTGDNTSATDTPAATKAPDADNEGTEGVSSDLRAYEGTTITFAHGQGEWMYQMFYDLADEFYEKTGIKVEYIEITSDSSGDTWITASYASGDEPDMMYASGFKGKDYFAQGKILDLTPYYNSVSPFSGEIWKDGFIDGVLADCMDSAGSSYIAGTISRAEVKFYYNKDLMQELGLGTEPPQSFSELFDMCQVILEDGRYVPFSVMNSMSWNLGWLQGALLNGYYSDSDAFNKLNIINPDNNAFDNSEILLGLKTGVLDYTDERLISYFSMMKDFTKYFNKDFNAASWEYESLFNDGKAVFNLNGGWFPSQVMQNDIQVNYGTASIPYIDKATYENGYAGAPVFPPSTGEPALYISQKAADEGRAEACVMFLQYLTDKNSGAQLFLDKAMLMPTVKDLVYPEAIAGLAEPNTEVEYTYLLGYDRMFSFSDSAGSAFWTAYTEYLDPSGSKTAQEFAQEIKELLMPLAEEEIADRPEYAVESFIDKIK